MLLASIRGATRSVAERGQRESGGTEDCFFQECTDHYPAAVKIRAPCSETHRVLIVKTGPEVQGWPTTRPRSFTAGLSKTRLRWLGPESDAEVQADFTKLFARSTELTGDVFGFASEEEILRSINRRLALRGLPAMSLPLTFNLELLYEILAPGAKQRLEKYIAQLDFLEGIGGAYLCDVEQWPEKGKAAAGPYFPCQLTHGTIVSLSTSRIFLGMEHVAAQGFHVDKEASVTYQSVMKEVLSDLSEKEQKEPSGNAMSLPAWAAWFMYVLSHTERIDPNEPKTTPQPENNMLSKGSSTIDFETVETVESKSFAEDECTAEEKEEQLQQEKEEQLQQEKEDGSDIE